MPCVVETDPASSLQSSTLSIASEFSVRKQHKRRSRRRKRSTLISRNAYIQELEELEELVQLNGPPGCALRDATALKLNSGRVVGLPGTRQEGKLDSKEDPASEVRSWSSVSTLSRTDDASVNIVRELFTNDSIGQLAKIQRANSEEAKIQHAKSEELKSSAQRPALGQRVALLVRFFESELK